MLKLLNFNYQVKLKRRHQRHYHPASHERKLRVYIAVTYPKKCSGNNQPAYTTKTINKKTEYVLFAALLYQGLFHRANIAKRNKRQGAWLPSLHFQTSAIRNPK